MKEHAFDPDRLSLPEDRDISGSNLPPLPETPDGDIPGLIELTEVVEPLELEREKSEVQFSLLDDTFDYFTEKDATGLKELSASDRATEIEEDPMLDMLKLIDGPDLSGASEKPQPGGIDLALSTDPTAASAPFLDEEPEGLLCLDDILNPEQAASAPPVDFADPGADSPVSGIEEPAITLTPAAIEKAIDRIIQTRHGQTIEEMIATIVEKVVLREMQALKRSLMENEDDLTG